MDLYEELNGISRILEKAGLKYAICGGIAVAFHGYARFTKDIDLLVPPDQLEAILREVGKLGYDMIAGPIAFGTGTKSERRIYRATKAEGAEYLTIDLLLVNDMLEAAWEGREIFEWQGGEIRVVSAAGLAQMKRLAGRDQDLLDIKMLGLDKDE